MSNIIEASSISKKVQLGKDNELHILKDVNLEIKGRICIDYGSIWKRKINSSI